MSGDVDLRWCCFHNDYRTLRIPAVWIWYHQPAPNISGLCEDCFNGSMRLAADGKIDPPVRYHRAR